MTGEVSRAFVVRKLSENSEKAKYVVVSYNKEAGAEGTGEYFATAMNDPFQAGDQVIDYDEFTRGLADSHPEMVAEVDRAFEASREVRRFTHEPPGEVKEKEILAIVIELSVTTA